MRWKYVYYFLIVTFLVIIFVSLISISVAMYLNELKNEPVTIYSVDPTSNTPVDIGDYNNCSKSISNQSFEDITKNPAGDGLRQTGETDNKDDVINHNETNLTPTPDKLLQRLDIDNLDWILAIFFRNKSNSLSKWKYGSMGVLIHPKAVLTVHIAINKYEDIIHVVGIFDRTNAHNKIHVNSDRLYYPLKIASGSPNQLIEFSYVLDNKKNYETKYEMGMLMMIMEEAINFIKPVDISQRSLMPLQDIFDERIMKECIHMTFIENPYTHIFKEIKVFEKLMTRSAIVESYKKTFEDKCVKPCEYASVNHLPESNIFGTTSNWKFDNRKKIFNMLGSPLACRVVNDKPDNYSFAGILVNSFYNGMYEYINVHHELTWIQQNLKKIIM